MGESGEPPSEPPRARQLSISPVLGTVVVPLYCMPVRVLYTLSQPVILISVRGALTALACINLSRVLSITLLVLRVSRIDYTRRPK